VEVPELVDRARLSRRRETQHKCNSNGEKPEYRIAVEATPREETGQMAEMGEMEELG
jgi:hypothetical protein